MGSFNLDDNKNLLKNVTLCQDIRDVHSKCQIIFSHSDDLDFSDDFGFILFGIEWDVISYRKTDIQTGFSYSVIGYPKATCSYITSKHNTLSALARNQNIKFDSEESTDLHFEFPLRDIRLGSLLFKYRYNSIERNLSDLSRAYFLFYDYRGLVGRTYSELGNSPAVELNVSELQSFGGSISFVRDFLLTGYHSYHFPSVLQYKDIASCFIGDKFEIKTLLPGTIGYRYKFTGEEEDKYASYNKLILVRQTCDYSRSLDPWTLTFGQLQV